MLYLTLDNNSVLMNVFINTLYLYKATYINEVFFAFNVICHNRSMTDEIGCFQLNKYIIYLIFLSLYVMDYIFREIPR